MSVKWPAVLVVAAASLPWTARGAEPSGKEILEQARETAVADARDLRSAHGKGTLLVRRKAPADEKEVVWSEGTFELFWKEGRCRLDLHFTRHRVRVVMLGQGQEKEREQHGDLKGERRVILGDAHSGTVVTFSPRIHPTGCRVENSGSLDDAIAFAEFPFRHPAQLWQDVMNVDRLIVNLDGDPITFADGQDGRLEGRYRVKNSKRSHARFEIEPRSGYRVTSHRDFVDPSTTPLVEKQVVWGQAESMWFVKELHLTERFGGQDETRTSVIYTTFAPNEKVDDSVFELQSLGIPARARRLGVRE